MVERRESEGQTSWLMPSWTQFRGWFLCPLMFHITQLLGIFHFQQIWLKVMFKIPKKGHQSQPLQLYPDGPRLEALPGWTTAWSKPSMAGFWCGRGDWPKIWGWSSKHAALNWFNLRKNRLKQQSLDPKNWRLGALRLVFSLNYIILMDGFSRMGTGRIASSKIHH